MAIYKYVATDAFGARIIGSYEAFNDQEVRIYLRSANLTPVEIRRSWVRADVKMGRGSGVKLKDLIIFSRMFAVMSKAAIPIDQALKALHEQTTSKPLKRAIQRMIVDVESGLALSESMRKQPAIFDTIYTNMIAAGEASGNMDVLMERLADLLERTAQIRAKVKGAMIYPIAILVVALGAVATLLTFVLPQFVDMFQSSGVALPLPTRIAMGTSKILTNDWWAIGLGLLVLAAVFKYLGRVPGFIRLRDTALLRAKIIGDVVVKGAVARFTRTLGILVASGVPILEGLDLTADTAGNVIIASAILDARTSIATGSDIAEPLKKSGVFPPLVTSMIAIGEQAGELDMMLDKIADFYERDVNEAVDAALKMIEPIMLVFLGGLVGGIMISLYLPMFDMISAVGSG